MAVMRTLAAPDTLVVRPSPGWRVMPLLDALAVLLFLLCAGMLFAARPHAPPGSGDAPGLLAMAAVFVALAVYRAATAVVARLPLAVGRDGRAIRGGRTLRLAQPIQVSFEHEYRGWYRTCIVYANGRLLARTHHGYREDEALAQALADFLGVPAYRCQRGQPPRKLSRKA